jgi:hypothetical protein
VGLLDFFSCDELSFNVLMSYLFGNFRNCGWISWVQPTGKLRIFDLCTMNAFAYFLSSICPCFITMFLILCNVVRKYDLNSKSRNLTQKCDSSKTWLHRSKLKEYSKLMSSRKNDKKSKVILENATTELHPLDSTVSSRTTVKITGAK